MVGVVGMFGVGFGGESVVVTDVAVLKSVECAVAVFVTRDVFQAELVGDSDVSTFAVVLGFVAAVLAVRMVLAIPIYQATL